MNKKEHLNLKQYRCKHCNSIVVSVSSKDRGIMSTLSFACESCGHINKISEDSVSFSVQNKPENIIRFDSLCNCN